MGYRGVLHTNAKDYADFTFEIPAKKSLDVLQSQIDRLRDLEENFYSSFFPGCRSVESFIQKLNKELKTFEQDKEAFRFFQNNNIRSALTKKFGTTTLEETEVTINFESQNAEIDFKKLLNIKGVKIEGSTIKLGSDPGVIKEAFNKLFSKTFRKSNTTNKKFIHKFIADLQDMSSEEIIELLGPKFREGVYFIKIEGNVGTKVTDTRKLKSPSFFGYNASDIEAAKEVDNQQLRKDIIDAKNQILNFILDAAKTRGASSNMTEAILLTWQSNFGQNLDQIAFWEKGGVLTALVGAFGEFQAALLQNYIKVCLRKSSIPPAIISQTIGQQEQGKVDITFLKGLGVQVKNYNKYTTGKQSDLLKGNIHPDKLVSYPSFNVSVTSFFDFLTNFFFNKTYQQEHQSDMNKLEEVLNSYFAEIMSFDLSLQVADTVTFYFIEGQYFVPASEILRQEAENLLSLSNVEVTSEYKGKTDEEYAAKKKMRGRKNQIFLEWWRTNKNVEYGFSPTSENYQLYNSLISSKISIRTGFHYRPLANLSHFALF